MRKPRVHYLIISVGLILFFGITSDLALAVDSYPDQMARRGGRGVLNVASSPLDFFNSIEDVRFNEGIWNALTYGVIKGTGLTCARMLYGFYEIGTFYAPYLNDQQFEVDYDSAVFRI